jgi:hypothetical protein
MAETTNRTTTTSPKTGTTRGGAASRPATTTRRRSAATRRSTAAKRASATRARTRAKAQVREAAPKTRAEQVADYAERAVNVQIGAALEARERVVSTVTDVVDLTTSRTSAEQQLKKLERRGSTARTRVEREARKARTRVERELRRRRTRLERNLGRNRKRVERELRSAERDSRGVRENVAANVDLVTAQVENAVQSGITAGAKLVGSAAERA